MIAFHLNGNGYDGAALYSNAHPARGEQLAAQDNLLAGTGTTVAALKADIQTAIARLNEFVDEANDPFHTMIDPADLVVVVPPALEFPMREAVEATIIANTTNVLSGIIGRVMVAPGQTLVDSNDWYLFHNGNPVRALIFQERDAMEFTELTTGDQAFDQEVFKFKARARYECAPGMWQNTVKTTNA